MKTTHKILIPVFSVLLVLAAALLVLSFNTGFLDKLSGGTQADISDKSFKGDDIAQITVSSALSESPMIKSDIDGIYYSVKADGSVKFFEFNGTAFQDYTGEVKSLDVSPECTYINIPIKIFYISKDGKTLGYGLYTSENSDKKVNLYSYVFAKLTDAPSIYNISGKLLLLCTDKSYAFSDDKVYSEAFSVKMDSGKCSKITAERDRSADRNGQMSARWIMFTDSFLKTVSKRASFISGRNYSEGTDTFDIYDHTKGVMSPVITGLYTTFFREADDSGYIYLKKTSDGFKSVKYIVDEKTIAEVKGDEFIFDGDWVYSKTDEKFINLVSGKTIDASKITTKFNSFCINESATRAAIFASGANQTLIILNTEANTVQSFVGERIFSTSIDNVTFVKDDLLLASGSADVNACSDNLLSVK